MLKHSVTVRAADYEDIRPLRELFRREAKCQIVRDSILRRGLADAYVISVEGDVVGYAGVWNRHYENRLMEFFTLSEDPEEALILFTEVVRISGATHIEAQTNLPAMAAMLRDCATDVAEEHILFEDGPPTELICADTVLRPREPGDVGPDGEWVVERNGSVIAAGGVLYHYNPPYGDIHMEVVEEARRQGVGSFLVQELRRVCSEEGKLPAARCEPGNHGSIGALRRGGLQPCGRLLAGEIRFPRPESAAGFVKEM